MKRLFRRTLRSRPRFYGALVTILGVGTALTAAGAFTTGAWRDVLINVGASVITVFLTALALEPLVEQGRRPEEVIHPDFPHQRFLDGMEGSTHRVRIMGAWPYVMDQQWRPLFLATLSRTLDRGVVVEILVMDPTSKAAEQRDVDLHHEVQVSAVISDVIADLSRYQRGLPESSAARLGVRVFDSLPPARLYRWDNRAISSFFPMGTGLGTEVRHYETNVTSSLGRFVDEQFDLAWRDRDTRDLQDFLTVSMTLVATGRRYRARYVIAEGQVYVASLQLTDSLFRNALHGTEVRIDLPRPDDGTRYTVETVPDGDPAAETIEELMRRKYTAEARRDGMQGVLRLLPTVAP
jgi:hypothetical protein